MDSQPSKNTNKTFIFRKITKITRMPHKSFREITGYFPGNPFPGILNELLTQKSCKSAKRSLSYKPSKFTFVLKLKPEASKWHFWLKSHRPSFLLFLYSFKANQMGFDQVFDNLTFKQMDAARK